MKRNKKIVAFMLALVLALGIFSSSAFAEVVSDREYGTCAGYNCIAHLSYDYMNYAYAYTVSPINFVITSGETTIKQYDLYQGAWRLRDTQTSIKNNDGTTVMIIGTPNTNYVGGTKYTGYHYIVIGTSSWTANTEVIY